MPSGDSVRDSYDAAAAAYAEHLSDELDHKPLDRHLLNRFAEETAGRGPVADLGCGPGHVAAYLAARGVDVIGIDLSPGMIAEASSRHPGIDFRTGDMRRLDLADASLAGAVAFYSIVHFDAAQLPPVFAELRRVLAPGGLALVAFHVRTRGRRRGRPRRGPLRREGVARLPVPLAGRGRARARRRRASASSSASSASRTRAPSIPSRRCYLLARARPAS